MMVENESNLRSGLNQHAADQIASKLEQLRERVSSEDSAIAKLRTDLKITDAGQGEALQERRVTELNQQYTFSPSPAPARRARSSINCARPISRPRARFRPPFSRRF